jgi:PKD repeat protein
MQNPSYTFTMTTADAHERFLLHFVPGATLEAIATECDGSNGQLDVNLGSYTVGTTSIGWDSYRLQHVDGAVVATGTPASSTLSFSGLVAGEYALVLTSGSYEATEALRIEQPLVATAGFEAAGSEFYAGEPLQLLDRSEGSAEYRYDFGDGTILTGEASPMHTFAEAGSYLVSQEVWSADGCLDQNTQTITVMNRVSSGLDASVNSMVVWTQGLQAFVNVSDLQPGARVVLADVLGRRVAQNVCNQSPCSVTALAPGAYILMLESDQGTSSRQVILQQ